MKSMKEFIFLISMVMVAVITGCSSEESVDSSESEEGKEISSAPFYESGDVIELIVPFSVGGGSDTGNRFMAPFIGDHTEGTPSMQVVNIPGGAALSGSNEFAMREHDGYSLLGANSSVVNAYLLGRSEVRYDINDWEPIMGVPTNHVVSISTSMNYEEPKDFLELEDGALAWAINDPTAVVPFITAFELLDLSEKIDLVYGYDGGGARLIAIEQGEIDLDNQADTTYKMDVMPMEERGISVPVFQIGILNEEGNFERDPEIDAPTVQEFYVELYGEEPSGQKWDAFKLFGGALLQVHRIVYVHGDAPEEAIQALKDGSEKAAQDPEFVEGAMDALGTNSAFVGESLERALEQQRSLIEEETLDYVRNLLAEKYEVKGLE